jgi:hypothetical protein
MARRDYFTQACPEPWQILGVRLRPFSLGHYFKLRRLDCAFVNDESRTASMYDLLMGIAVCSMTSDPDPDKDQFWQWFYGSSKASFRLRLRNAFYALARKAPLTIAEWDMMAWGKECGEFDFAEKAKLFARYIAEHSTAPGFWEDTKGETHESGAHWSHSVLSVLTGKCGYTLEQAHNAPMSRALFDFYKIAESEGCGRMMTEQELKLTGTLDGA